MSVRVVYLNGASCRRCQYRSTILPDRGRHGVRGNSHVRWKSFSAREHLTRLEQPHRVHTDPGLSIDELTALTEETLARNRPTEASDVDWNIIHNVSRGPASAFAEAFEPDEIRPTVVISCFPLLSKMAWLAPKYEEGIDLVVPQQRALPTDLMHAQIKTRSRLHYQLANFEAEAKMPGSTAVLVDPDGYLTEGTSGNLFLVTDGRLQTPEPRNLLPGVTRSLILELADRLRVPRIETNLTVSDAQAADEAFITSTSIGILHARSFEGHTVGQGRIGPITSQLRTALIDVFGLDLAEQARQYAARLQAQNPIAARKTT